MAFGAKDRGSVKPSVNEGIERQRTLKSSIDCTGIGLHSGAKIRMTIHPGEADTGIVFRRTDIAGGGVLIPGTYDRVSVTNLCTTIAAPDGASIATVEHLMAALAGCRIDNAYIEVNGPEIPVGDGSAEPFAFLFDCAGVTAQDVPRRGVRILKPVAVTDGNKRAELWPGEGFSVGMAIDFNSAAVSKQNLVLGLVNGTFRKELSRARTFGFLHEVEQLRAAGLARGGSLKNAVVISGDEILNKEGLRYEDEFVRHKMLDAVGDLYLAGAPLIGHFRGRFSGHALNNKLLHALFADEEAWRLEPMAVETDAHAPIVTDWDAPEREHAETAAA